MNFKAGEKFGDKIIRYISELVEEMEASGDDESLEVMPKVLLTIAVMSLCRQSPPDEVMDILSVMKLKVERGDFHLGPEKGFKPVDN